MNCSSSPLDNLCVCNSSLAKIYNVNSNLYSCCDIIDYKGNSVNPECQNWRTFNLESYIYTNPKYGPTSEFLKKVNEQIKLSEELPLADVENTKYVCYNDKVPKYLEYPDPNNDNKSSFAVICVNPDNYNSYEDLTFYSIKNCSLTGQICTPEFPIGDLNNIGNMESGTSKKNKLPTNTPAENRNENDKNENIKNIVVIITIVILIIISIIFITLFSVYYHKYKVKNNNYIPQYNLNYNKFNI